jgi:hypothetical protein
MKKVILALVLGTSLLLPKPVLAQEQVCTTVYGGGTVCGAHVPVDTDWGDINPSIIGSVLLTFSGLIYVYSTKKSLKSQGVNNK